MEHNIIYAFNLSVAGIGIVFASLILIAIAIRTMRSIDEALIKKREQKDVPESAKEQTLDNLTLVLISAAVAAKLQEKKYAIRNVRRIVSRDATIASWTMEGLGVLHGSHVINLNKDK